LKDSDLMRSPPTPPIKYQSLFNFFSKLILIYFNVKIRVN